MKRSTLILAIGMSLTAALALGAVVVGREDLATNVIVAPGPVAAPATGGLTTFISGISSNWGAIMTAVSTIYFGLLALIKVLPAPKPGGKWNGLVDIFKHLAGVAEPVSTSATALAVAHVNPQLLTKADLTPPPKPLPVPVVVSPVGVATTYPVHLTNDEMNALAALRSKTATLNPAPLTPYTVPPPPQPTIPQPPAV